MNAFDDILPALSEDELQATVVDHLIQRERIARDVYVMHVPNEAGAGGEKARNAQKKKLRLGMRPGAPDLILFTRHGVLAIEMKAENGRRSDAQKEVAATLGGLGHRYCLVRARTPGDALSQIEAAMVLLADQNRGRAA